MNHYLEFTFTWDHYQCKYYMRTGNYVEHYCGILIGIMLANL